MIKVLIADDQELIRQSLSIILGLKEEISVVGGVGDGTEVLEFIAKEKPDIILMDIRMPTMDGVECTKIVKGKYPEIKIIVLTTFDDDKYVFSALKYGASGYLLKGISVDELEKAIQSYEFILSCLSEESRRIIEKDFLYKDKKDWWVLYYSRSTYYRLKTRAMEEILYYFNCLERS